MSNYLPTSNEFRLTGPDFDEELTEPCQVDLGNEDCLADVSIIGYKDRCWLECNDGHTVDLPPIEPDV